MSLEQKTITGLTWSFIDSFTNQGIQFVIGIILARLLSPKEFGLIGIILIFTAISQSFIDSGFSQALIRKNNCGQEDYSTTFYFNFAVGILFYLILFFLAGPISNFFKEPQLLVLIRVLGINLIISAVGLIQRTILTKNVNFKLQTKISAIATIVSGTIGIGMAYYGWGVWSLVWMAMSQNLVMVTFLWLWSSWRPILLFSTSSFCQMFGFGSKLLAAGLIDVAYRNIYYLIIGKYFSAADLGYYTRADEFRNIPSAHLSTVIGRVSYPILSKIQDDDKRLKNGYKKLIRSTMFISFALMIGMAAVAKPLIRTLIGDKWLPAVPYLQLLCFVGVLYPLHALNLNMLNVKGRSDLILKLEMVKKPLTVPTIIVGVFFGIKIMIIGMILNSLVSLFLNSYWSGKMVNYPVKEQLLDIAPSFTIAIIMGITVFLVGHFLPFSPILVLGIQIAIGIIVFIGIVKLTKLDIYEEMQNLFISNFAAFFPFKKNR